MKRRRHKGGALLRRIRQARGLTGTEAAARVGISAQYLQLMELGLRPVTRSALARFAETFKVSYRKLKEELDGR